MEPEVVRMVVAVVSCVLMLLGIVLMYYAKSAWRVVGMILAPVSGIVFVAAVIEHLISIS